MVKQWHRTEAVATQRGPKHEEDQRGKYSFSPSSLCPGRSGASTREIDLLNPQHFDFLFFFSCLIYRLISNRGSDLGRRRIREIDRKGAKFTLFHRSGSGCRTSLGYMSLFSSRLASSHLLAAAVVGAVQSPLLVSTTLFPAFPGCSEAGTLLMSVLPITTSSPVAEETVP